jgi:branched-chain amino acid transport system permease protein
MLGGVARALIEASAGYVGDLTNLCQLSGWSDAIARRCVDDPNSRCSAATTRTVRVSGNIAVLIFRPSASLGERQRPRLRNRRCGSSSTPKTRRRVDRHRLIAIALAVALRAVRHRHCLGAHHELAILVRAALARSNIVVGFAGLLDLGYIAFYAVGAYVYALLASPHFNLHLPFWIILPIGAAVACLFGVLLGAPTLKLRGDYLAIVTLGFGEIIRIFLNNLSQPVNLTNGPQGITLIDPFRIDGFNSRRETVFGLDFTGPVKYDYFLVLLLIVIIVVNLRLQDSRIGRAWEAIREDEIAARAMGINTRNLKLLAFAMGASFGGISGGIFSATQGFISPESFVLVESIMVLSMVVLGGMGNIWGVILGAVLLSFVPEVLRYTVEPVQRAVFGRMLIEPEVIRMLLFGLALVLMMLFRPAGILPSALRKRELEAK